MSNISLNDFKGKTVFATLRNKTQEIGVIELGATQKSYPFILKTNKRDLPYNDSGYYFGLNEDDPYDIVDIQEAIPACNSTAREWADALIRLIDETDETGGDGPSLWKWNDTPPSPQVVVECLREHIEYLKDLSAREELNACCELIINRYNGCTLSGVALGLEVAAWLRNSRRPTSQKELALINLKVLRKDKNISSDLLDTIESALNSIS